MTDQANPGITFLEAQRQQKLIAEARRKARAEYTAEKRKAAEMKNEHTKGFALKFAEHRAEGKAVEESKVLAKSDVAHLELAHDLADAAARSALLRIEELEAGRATVRQLSEWTRDET